TKGSPQGGVIMKELGNATIRAELGQATWRLIHTMASRYPKLPNADEQIAFRSFVHLLSRLYPCGQCAKHFQQLLKIHPPQTGSRDEVTQWACKVHNIVNERLDKPQFNCSLVLETWKCGCAED
ncbi:ERV/ALR sulfhydryl oxidase domain-containing protein, partial [Piptocephalis cylindrospora]